LAVSFSAISAMACFYHCSRFYSAFCETVLLKIELGKRGCKPQIRSEREASPSKTVAALRQDNATKHPALYAKRPRPAQ
ncbi:MAG: hypothetical protein RSD82_06900, partial [Comamonas sp.]